MDYSVQDKILRMSLLSVISSEREDDGASGADGGVDRHPNDVEPLPQTQNSANLTPEDTESEHDEDPNTDSRFDSSLQEEHNRLDPSNKEPPTPAATELRGFEMSEGERKPNCSQEETQTNEENRQKTDLLSEESTDRSEEDQHKSDPDDSASEDEAAQNKAVVKEAEASDGNTHRETSEGGKDSNLLPAEVTSAEDNLQENNQEDSADEDKLTNDSNGVEEAETSRDQDRPSKEDTGHCEENFKDTEPPATTEQINPQPTEGGKEPKSPPAGATPSEDNSEPAQLRQTSESLAPQDADGERDRTV